MIYQQLILNKNAPILNADVSKKRGSLLYETGYMPLADHFIEFSVIRFYSILHYYYIFYDPNPPPSETPISSPLPTKPPCPDHCKQCTEDECNECEEGFLIYNGDCVSSCPKNTIKIENEKKCVDGYFYDKPLLYRFSLPAGKYLVECYGAQGGKATTDSVQHSFSGGKGAYAKGVLTLKERSTNFVARVGGQGKYADGDYDSTTNQLSGGYNGGAYGGSVIFAPNGKGGGGGGSTELRLDNDERMIIAAGGSGAVYTTDTGSCGAPGGDKDGRKITGISKGEYVYEKVSNSDLYDFYIIGGGDDGEKASYSKPYSGSGGGGGFKGGNGGKAISSADPIYDAVGEGGSSFISGYDGLDVISNTPFTEGEMIAGVHEGDGKFNLSIVCLFGEEIDQLCEEFNNDCLCSKCSGNTYIDNGICKTCPDGSIGTGTQDSCIFPPTSHFSKSDEFSYSNKFTNSGEFSYSNKFTNSDIFSYSNAFSNSNELLLSKSEEDESSSLSREEQFSSTLEGSSDSDDTNTDTSKQEDENDPIIPASETVTDQGNATYSGGSLMAEGNKSRSLIIIGVVIALVCLILFILIIVFLFLRRKKEDDEQAEIEVKAETNETLDVNN